MTNPTRKPGDPGHPVDLMDALHDRAHEEPGLHPNPRWGPRRERMTKSKRVRIAVAVDRDGSVQAVLLRGRERAESAMWRDFDGAPAGARLVVVEADVPLPEEPAVVRGEVVDG